MGYGTTPAQIKYTGFPQLWAIGNFTPIFIG